jgi:hypothetical protein
VIFALVIVLAPPFELGWEESESVGSALRTILAVYKESRSAMKILPLARNAFETAGKFS